MLYVFLFIIGLAVGSFINVVSLRYQPGQKLLSKDVISGRSHCPHCFRKLNWYELVPIFSFLFQKRKCRHCGGGISFQYPLVEILSGLIFISVPLSLSHFPASVSVLWILIFLFFLLLSIIDIRHYLIPDQLNLLLAILGIVLIIFTLYSAPYTPNPNYSLLGYYSLLFNTPENVWLNHTLAALIAMAFFGAIIIFTRGRAMGWGDFKLAGALGLIFGWPDIIMIIGLSFIIGALFTLPFLISGKKTMKDAVPFGPFLIAASALIFFFGFQIVDAYFKLFGIII